MYIIRFLFDKIVSASTIVVDVKHIKSFLLLVITYTRIIIYDNLYFTTQSVWSIVLIPVLK